MLVWLMLNEKKVSSYDTGPTVWHCPLTTPMTLTMKFQGQGLKLYVYISGMERPIDMGWKGCETSIHDHDID